VEVFLAGYLDKTQLKGMYMQRQRVMDIKPQLQPVKNFQSSDLAKQVARFRLARSIIWLHAGHAKIHLGAPRSDKKTEGRWSFPFSLS
jgi:hypothetical protein